MRKRLTGPYPSLVNYWLARDSREEAVITFSCIVTDEIIRLQWLWLNSVSYKMNMGLGKGIIRRSKIPHRDRREIREDKGVRATRIYKYIVWHYQRTNLIKVVF